MSVQACVRKLGFCTCLHHGYLVNIDNLLVVDYYNTVVALSISCNATSAIMRGGGNTCIGRRSFGWRNCRRPKKKSSFKVISGSGVH